MSYQNNKYSELEALFKEFIEHSNVGAYVTNIALTYINNAQQSLNTYRKWQGLLKKVALTLTNKTSQILPKGIIYKIYDDADNDGMPDRFYYKGTMRQDNGYYVNETFNKTTGTSRTITFYLTPPSTVYFEYFQILDDFIGTGTEYSYFPSNLITAKAQMLYLEDNGRIGTAEYALIQNRFNNEVLDFSHATQTENIDFVMEIKDDFGRLAEVEAYNLSTGDSYRRSYDRYEPGVDL